jgi:poly(3-hydroxybutyrate) depolymerase
LAHPVAPRPAAARLRHARHAPSADDTPGLQTIQTRDATILVPTDLVPGRTYPLVVAFAYNGNPSVPFQVWRTQAAANDWIVYASKDYQNAVLRGGVAPSEKTAAKIKAQIDALPATLPVDMTRIIFTGMSGGANFSDYMNLRYPGYAAGVIINSGKIPFQLFHKTPKRGFDTLPTATDFTDSRRVGVFLASPSDSDFYGITQSNAKYMQSLGWDTVFFSFPGGHWNAPPATYTKAIDWILSQPSWTGNP